MGTTSMRYVNAYTVGKSAEFDLKPVNCAGCSGSRWPGCRRDRGSCDRLVLADQQLGYTH